ncbi:hypothetical protein TREPR_2293 [Treponema primitia ZAS-2]|uniref:Uncharacterized protein n=1 Tax=Treponema primitia (strain ATCC BAA-887 / DSM 12427 / ZAS-2) TaxID=545694 RepID=F5YI11_TREPZ|nr:hypothetical protein TREPR_2293 [Treponema primitia ZAS-2]
MGFGWTNEEDMNIFVSVEKLCAFFLFFRWAKPGNGYMFL